MGHSLHFLFILLLISGSMYWGNVGEKAF